MPSFTFIRFDDVGSGNCPHCGAEGRYIYTWEVDGVRHSAMAGCYKALTGRLEKDEVQKYLEKLSEKVVRGKELTGWDRQSLGILKAVNEGRASREWADKKLREVVSGRKMFLANRRQYSAIERKSK